MYYFIFGSRRSGNHAIIGWLYGLFKETYVHMNDLQEIDLEQFKKGMNTLLTHFYIDRKFVPFQGAKYVIISFENKTPEILKDWFEYLDSKEIDYRIVIIFRDVLNLYASWIQTYKKVPENAVNSYKRIMDILLDTPKNKYLFIFYPKWNDEQKYRNDLALALGHLNHDIHFNECIGYGTSFFENRTTIDHTLYNKRWTRFKDHQYLNNIDRDVLIKWKAINEKFHVISDAEYNDFVNKLFQKNNI